MNSNYFSEIYRQFVTPVYWAVDSQTPWDIVWDLPTDVSGATVPLMDGLVRDLTTGTSSEDRVEPPPLPAQSLSKFLSGCEINQHLVKGIL